MFAKNKKNNETSATEQMFKQKVKYGKPVNITDRTTKLPAEYLHIGCYTIKHLTATADETKKRVCVGNKNATGVFLGQVDKEGEQLVSLDMESYHNNHIAVCGGAGSGKTRSFSMPFIEQAIKRGESIVVADPTGELLAKNENKLIDNGYLVRVVDLSNPQKSDSWNVLNETKGDFRVHLLLDMLLSKTLNNTNKGAMAALLEGVCKRVLLGTDIPATEKNMQKVYELIAAGAEVLHTYFDANKLNEVGAFEALRYYQIYRGVGEDERDKVAASLAAALKMFQTDDGCALTALDQIDLEVPAHDKSAYFVIMPDHCRPLDILPTLFLEFLLIDLVQYIDNKGVENCIPVNLLIDGMWNVPAMPDFERKLATLRSRNIRVALVFRSVSELQSIYPNGKWAAIINNCDAALIFGGCDVDTARYFGRECDDAVNEILNLSNEFVVIGFNSNTGLKIQKYQPKS